MVLVWSIWMTARRCAWNAIVNFQRQIKQKYTLKRYIPLIPMTNGSPVTFVANNSRSNATWPITCEANTDCRKLCLSTITCPTCKVFTLQVILRDSLWSWANQVRTMEVSPVSSAMANSAPWTLQGITTEKFTWQINQIGSSLVPCVLSPLQSGVIWRITCVSNMESLKQWLKPIGTILPE